MIKRLLCVGGIFMCVGLSTAIAGPLHDAASQGNTQQAAGLLDQGAVIEEHDDSGDTALILAALGGYADTVRLLLDRGADIRGRNAHGLTALHAAAYGGHVDVVDLLIAKGAPVNDSENFFHMAPLHAAAEENHKDVVEILLAHGADIEAQERNGYTPLSQAGWRDYWDTAAVLMKAGAKCQGADMVGDRLYMECTKRQ